MLLTVRSTFLLTSVGISKDLLPKLAQQLNPREPCSMSPACALPRLHVHQQLSFVTPANQRQAFHSFNNKTTILFDGWLAPTWFHDPDPPWPASRDPLHRILQAYRDFGVNFASHLDGEFAVILLDFEHDWLLVATDAFGTRPLFFTLDDDGYEFGAATQLAALRMTGLSPTQLRSDGASAGMHVGEVRGFTSRHADGTRKPSQCAELKAGKLQKGSGGSVRIGANTVLRLRLSRPGRTQVYIRSVRSFSC